MNAAAMPAEPFTCGSADAFAFLGTAPIPPAAYHDPAWFELEREAVFRQSWLYVGHVSELPVAGAFVRREIEVLKASLPVARDTCF